LYTGLTWITSGRTTLGRQRFRPRHIVLDVSLKG
jgi:hypothetical protein